MVAAETQPHTPEPPKARVPSDQRRSQLLEAAIRVFSKTGFCGTKTRDIAAEAHINEALLFRHFGTKEELYAAILEATDADEWVDAVRSVVDTSKGDTDRFVREYVRQTLDWYRRHPERLRLLLYSALEQHELAERFRDKQALPVLELLANYIAEHQADGRFSSRIPPAHAARILFGTVAHQGLVLILLRGSDPSMTDEELTEAIAEIALHGLAAHS